MDIKLRFNSKYQISDSGCWNWTAGRRGKTGYGALKFKGKVIDSHRISYMIFKGEIPKGIFVCHRCDNRLCVNPDHLFLGTPKENYQDAVSKGRIKPLESRPLKHPSYWAYRKGCRCRQCRSINAARRKEQRNKKKMSGKQDSNLRPPASKAGGNS